MKNKFVNSGVVEGFSEYQEVKWAKSIWWRSGGRGGLVKMEDSEKES